MGRARILRQLSASLRGEPPADCDWAAVLTLANQSLVTPQLASALAGCADDIPVHSAQFLTEVLRRNRERNRRLWLQLNDAVAVLNDAGIEPVLLKGAAQWASFPERKFDRLLSDIDMMVSPAEVDDAVAALRHAGFNLANRYMGPTVHVVAEFGRDQDVGYLDLHQRPPGPPGIAETPDLAARRRTVRIAGGTVQLPDAASQILHLVLHDYFHDRGYWRGGFDLRHLTDVVYLAPSMTPPQWDWLRNACGTRLVRAALEAHLASSRLLVGGPGFTCKAGLRALWTYRRWFLQYSYPALRIPLAMLAVAVEWRDICLHRETDLFGRKRTGAGPGLAPASLARLRAIMHVQAGKI